MNGENELPEGWVEVSLNDVTINVKNVKPENEPERRFDYIDISSINNQTFTIKETKSFLGQDAPSRARRPVKKDDVVFSNVRTYLRNISVVPEEYDDQLCSTGFTVLRPSSILLPKYIFYFVLTDSFIDRVSPQQRGSQYPATSDGVVRSVIIPLPPLAEQRRIVAAVESLLARVNASRDRLDRVPGLLKAFRQAVLAAACSGKLTEGWRGENYEIDENSPNKTSQDPITTNFNIPRRWYLANLNSICTNIVDCPHSTPKWVEKGEICLRTTNFKSGHLDLSEVRYVNNETFKERTSRLIPQTDDIVYSREGGILGIACIIPEGLKACLGQRMMLLRVNRNKCHPNFLLAFLNSPLVLDKIKDLVGGTSSPHLNVGDVKGFSIPLPALSEQHEIVRRVEALFALADCIEQRVNTGKERADRLTQAILAKAFCGELVPTEAELARIEGREYEPASVLLERIRAEGSERSKGRRSGQR